MKQAKIQTRFQWILIVFPHVAQLNLQFPVSLGKIILQLLFTYTLLHYSPAQNSLQTALFDRNSFFPFLSANKQAHQATRGSSIHIRQCRLLNHIR